MIALDIEQQASQNLVGTYFRLGCATPGARIWKEDGFRICTGAFEHPICNFAADLNLTPRAVYRLQEIASNRTSFNVYVLPGDEPHGAGEMLLEAGFRVGHSLHQMAADPVHRPCGVELIEAVTPNERARVARFMVDQFFSRQAQTFRRRVAETTCAAVELPLYTVEDRGKIVGAVMLSESSSVLGIYNLCVASGFRGRGWGTELVQGVINMGAKKDRPVVLQCEAALQPWYSNRTFTPIGPVLIHSLPKSYALDIMRQR